MSPPRILLINHAAVMGGAEHILLDVARHLGQRCHVALFADGPLRARLEALDIAVSVVPGAAALMGVRREAGAARALWSAPAVLGLAARLARLARNFDLLYVNSQKAAVVGLIVGRMVGKPVVWHLHDILNAEHFAGPQRWAVIRLANLAARAVIANSEATRRAFIACGGDARRVTVVPNGVDPAVFATVPTAGQPRGGRGRVGLFGRLSPWKGQHVLIEALPMLPDVEAVMVGDALFGEAEYKRHLHDLAERLGVAGRIQWLGHRNDAAALMRGVDLVVHASTAPEPFGRVIVEAVMAGRPVLASRHGASAEILGDDSPWLVPPADPVALADAIRAMLARSADSIAADRLAAEVAAQRARMEALFSLQGMLHGIDRVVAGAA